MSSMEEANADRHYIALTIAIIIGIVGVYIRFADFHYASAVGNVLMVIASAYALKTVFGIIK